MTHIAPIDVAAFNTWCPRSIDSGSAHAIQRLQFLLFDRQPDGVLLVTLNRPEAMNATNNRMHWELTQVWGVVNDDPTVKAIVITGAGDRAFSAGGDLSVVEEMSTSRRRPCA